MTETKAPSRNLWHFPVGSLQSRVAARAKLEREPGTVLHVTVIHIGHKATDPLPAPDRIKWNGGLTEIVHLAGRAR